MGTDLIKQWEKGNELKSLKQFLDLYYFYLRGVKNFIKIVDRENIEPTSQPNYALLRHRTVLLFIESLPENNHYLKI